MSRRLKLQRTRAKFGTTASTNHENLLTAFDHPYAADGVQTIKKGIRQGYPPHPIYKDTGR